MGCILTSLVSSCLCSTASCCVSHACNCCGKAVTTPAVAKSVATRVVYALQLLLFALLAWVFNNLPHWTENSWIMQHIPFIKTCGRDPGCSGTLGVYRITAAVALYHGFLALMFIKVQSSKDPRASIQDGWWFFKFLFMILFTVIAFFIPPTAFVGYSWIALVGAILFILVQLILLVDMAHSLQESWVRNYEQSQHCIWAFLLLGGSIAAFVVMITGYVLLYVFFTQCQMNLTLITITVIAICAVTLLSILPQIQQKNPRSGLFQSAVVCGFATYLLASSILAEPESTKCKRWNTSGSAFTTIVGIAFSFVAVGYNVFAAAGSSRDFGFGRREKSAAAEARDEAREALLHDAEMAHELTSPASESPLAHTETSMAITDRAEEIVAEREGRKPATIVNRHVDDADQDLESGTSTEDEQEGVTYSYSFFHLIFVLAVLYLAMILTNWKSVSKKNDETTGSRIDVDYGMTAVWVKFSSCVAVLALYVWTLVAPIIFPDREWA